jgi:hypothetical protein
MSAAEAWTIYGDCRANWPRGEYCASYTIEYAADF